MLRFERLRFRSLNPTFSGHENYVFAWQILCLYFTTKIQNNFDICKYFRCFFQVNYQQFMTMTNDG